METTIINAHLFKEMIKGGAQNLKKNVTEIDNLNVFPIPDGDTGDNMLMTMEGGANAVIDENQPLGEAATLIANGMLLGARGNSGVILSQLFDGIACGLKGLEVADVQAWSAAMEEGVKHAYKAVLTPTEGTILTVARESSAYALDQNTDSIEDYLECYLTEAAASLKRTPDLLAVLKKAGVVDSGGAGLIKIIQGMLIALNGDTDFEESLEDTPQANSASKIDISTFTEDSVLEFGYCTELLVRLQNSKCDVKNFDIDIVKNFLLSIGNSVVCFKNGSIVKLHVHTMTPDKVLAFLQQYGEFLTIKIENMCLQHNSLDDEIGSLSQKKEAEKKKYGIVAVACGKGIQDMFTELGVDVVINGGQSMNPSAKDFIDAFDKINAENIFVLPNNSNVILTANQAKKMYTDANIIVINSKEIGQGHAALTMMNTEVATPEEVEQSMVEAMEGVDTACVSICSRDTGDFKKGEYLGFVGDDISVHEATPELALEGLVVNGSLDDHEIILLCVGKEGSLEEANKIKETIENDNPFSEIYVVDGGQDIYNYMLILE